MEGRQLVTVKFAVLIVIAFGSLAGRSDYAWPFLTWTMYSTMPDAQRDRFHVRAAAASSEGSRQRSPARPPASAIELRAISGSGEAYTVALSNHEPTGAREESPPLFEMGRRSVAEQVVERAFDDSDPRQRQSHRTYLARVVASALPDVEVARIQGWKREWAVDPLALPPLNRDHPVRVVLLGTFDVGAHGRPPRPSPHAG